MWHENFRNLRNSLIAISLDPKEVDHFAFRSNSTFLDEHIEKETISFLGQVWTELWAVAEHLVGHDIGEVMSAVGWRIG